MALRHLVYPMTKVSVPIQPYLPNVNMKYDGENSIILDRKICTVMSNSVNICEMVDVTKKGAMNIHAIWYNFFQKCGIWDEFY